VCGGNPYSAITVPTGLRLQFNLRGDVMIILSHFSESNEIKF